jgi:hypothetical protein
MPPTPARFGQLLPKKAGKHSCKQAYEQACGINLQGELKDAGIADLMP